jgi:RimJ/RimL family protein N-acetyltransferase
VTLEPLHPDHLDDLVEAAGAERRTFGLTSVPAADRDAVERYVAGLLGDQASGRVAPFAQLDARTGRAVGCTRYMEPRHWRGRDEPDEIEIGGTWLAEAAQRTGINTEAKLLLLGHAFEVWEVWRVAICTDARNLRSRTAIERLGATFEGVLRHHRVIQGDAAGAAAGREPRDTATYSILAEEWPAIADRLRRRLAAAS